MGKTRTLITVGLAIGFMLLGLNSVYADDPRDSSFTRRDEFGARPTIPIAWGDYDLDGDLDLAVGNYGQANELYTNNGDGTFSQQDAFAAGATFAVVWVDTDNDGDPDLAAGNNGQNYLFENNGDGTFTEFTRLGKRTTVAMAWADYNLDGYLDCAVGNGILTAIEDNRLFTNNGDNTFSFTAEFGGDRTCSLAWADYDNDGDPDLAVGNGGFGYVAQNYLYINNGDGSFTDEAQFGTGDTAAVAWADANNDGWLDLAVGNWNAGQSMLYVNNGDGSFTGQAAFGNRDTNTLAWGDFDLDGDLDVAVGNGDFQNDEQNQLFVNDGSGSFTAEDQFGLGSTDSVAWGDYDGDGDLDLALGNEHSPPQNELWTNELSDYTYLRLHLVGQHHLHGPGFSNRDAVGAQVAVYAAGHAGDPAFRRGFQQVEAKGGFSSQNAKELTFGVPGNTTVDVVIKWPGSGGQAIAQTLAAVPVNQQVTVVENLLGDLNCDGRINGFDIDPFVQVLGGDLSEYYALYPDCDHMNADINADGAVDGFDIDRFILLLSGG